MSQGYYAIDVSCTLLTRDLFAIAKFLLMIFLGLSIDIH